MLKKDLTTTVRFRLDIDSNQLKRMDEELPEAPTYAVRLDPSKGTLNVVGTKDQATALDTKTSKDGLRARSLAEKLGESGADAAGGSPRYQPIGVLGEGGVGKVYAMVDSNVGREVAVKVLKGEHSDYDRETFIQEGMIAAKLEHPNIIPIYDLDADADGRLFLTMKNVKGHDLKAYIDGGKEMTPNELVIVLLKVCDALSYAHSFGNIHQDVKPDNIMIGDHGEVFLIDWGTSSGSGNERAMSPVYMSPQQAAGVDPTASDDIYCLGATLFHVLTRRIPTVAHSMEELWDKKLEGIVDPLTPAKERRLPKGLLSVAQQAMAADPEERYQSIEELADDLRAYLEGFATSAEHATALELMTLLVKRRWKETLAVAAAVVVLLSAGYIHYRSRVGKLTAELKAVDLDRKRLWAENRRNKLEDERRSEWQSVAVIDLSDPRSLDERLVANGSIMVEEKGVRLGYRASINSLAWTEPLGPDRKVEVVFSCASAARLQVSFLSHTDDTSLADHVTHSVLMDGGVFFTKFDRRGWRGLSGGKAGSAALIKYDAPNRLVAWRQGNRFFADLNGERVLEYHDSHDLSGGGEGYIKIERPGYYGYDPLYIRSIRLWKLRLPVYVSVLEVGRGMLRSGNDEGARKWFQRQAATCPDQAIAQEAEYLAAWATSDEDQRLLELKTIIAKPNHRFLAHSLRDAALITARRGAWKESLDYAERAMRKEEQFSVLGTVLPYVKRHLKKLPLEQRVGHLARFTKISRAFFSVGGMGISDVAFLKESEATGLDLSNSPVSDLSPLATMRLTGISLNDTKVADISPLRGMPLNWVNLRRAPVRDLSPLKGRRLWRLFLDQCKELDLTTLEGVKVRLLSINKLPIQDPSPITGTNASLLRLKQCGLTDISFVRGMSFWRLSVDKNSITDLTPLQDCSVGIADLQENKITDLAPLQGKDMASLNLSKNPITDISPLQGMPLRDLKLSETKITDISALKGMPLRGLDISYTKVKDLSPLLDCPNLRNLHVNGLDLDQAALDVLRKLPLTTLGVELKRDTLPLIQRIPTLTKFAGFRKKELAPIAPHLTNALQGKKLSWREQRQLRKHARRGTDRDLLRLPVTLTYGEAKDLCERLGGKIVCPSTPEQAKQLGDYLAARGWRYKWVWTGLEYRNDKFVFESGADPSWYAGHLTEDERKLAMKGTPVMFSASSYVVKDYCRVPDNFTNDQQSLVVIEWVRKAD